MLNGLDLFSGIGGISLALRDYVRPVAYCEIDPYCQGVLLTRMASFDLPNAAIWEDIKTLSEGIPFHVDRLRALGNSVCPQQTKEAFEILMGLK